MAALYEKSTLNAKISLFLLVVLGVFLIVAYASPYWTTKPDGNAGLWIACNGPDVACYERWNQWIAGWVRAIQVMLSISLMCWFFATLVLCLYLFFTRFQDDKRLIFLSCATTFICGVFTLLCVLTWAAGQHYGSDEILNWAFVMACFVVILSFVTFIFLLKELHQTNYASGYQKVPDVM